MNWAQMLANGPGESPGRAEAIARAQCRTEERYRAQGGIKRAKGSSKTKVNKVSRKSLRESKG